MTREKSRTENFNRRLSILSRCRSGEWIHEIIIVNTYADAIADIISRQCKAYTHKFHYINITNFKAISFTRITHRLIGYNESKKCVYKRFKLVCQWVTSTDPCDPYEFGDLFDPWDCGTRKWNEPSDVHQSGIPSRRRPTSLRSATATRHHLTVPRYRLSTFGRRAFSVAALTVWNSLPDSLRDPALTSNSFRQSLKTNLFHRYHSAYTAQ